MNIPRCMSRNWKQHKSIIIACWSFPSFPSREKPASRLTEWPASSKEPSCHTGIIVLSFAPLPAFKYDSHTVKVTLKSIQLRGFPYAYRVVQCHCLIPKHFHQPKKETPVTHYRDLVFMLYFDREFLIYKKRQQVVNAWEATQSCVIPKSSAW